jgi:hypothetical protein
MYHNPKDDTMSAGSPLRYSASSGQGGLLSSWFPPSAPVLVVLVSGQSRKTVTQQLKEQVSRFVPCRAFIFSGMGMTRDVIDYCKRTRPMSGEVLLFVCDEHEIALMEELIDGEHQVKVVALDEIVLEDLMYRIEGLFIRREKNKDA